MDNKKDLETMYARPWTVKIVEKRNIVRRKYPSRAAAARGLGKRYIGAVVKDRKRREYVVYKTRK